MSVATIVQAILQCELVVFVCILGCIRNSWYSLQKTALFDICIDL